MAGRRHHSAIQSRHDAIFLLTALFESGLELMVTQIVQGMLGVVPARHRRLLSRPVLHKRQDLAGVVAQAVIEVVSSRFGLERKVGHDVCCQFDGLFGVHQRLRPILIGIWSLCIRLGLDFFAAGHCVDRIDRRGTVSCGTVALLPRAATRTGSGSLGRHAAAVLGDCVMKTPLLCNPVTIRSNTF